MVHMHAYNGVLTILCLARFFVFYVSVKVKFTVSFLCVCVHFAWKGHPWNDLYCVGQDVKPYSLTHLYCINYTFMFILLWHCYCVMLCIQLITCLLTTVVLLRGTMQAADICITACSSLHPTWETGAYTALETWRTTAEI